MASAVFPDRWANDLAPNVITNQMNPQNFVFYIVNPHKTGQAGVQVGGVSRRGSKKGIHSCSLTCFITKFALNLTLIGIVQSMK